MDATFRQICEGAEDLTLELLEQVYPNVTCGQHPAVPPAWTNPASPSALATRPPTLMPYPLGVWVMRLAQHAATLGLDNKLSQDDMRLLFHKVRPDDCVVRRFARDVSVAPPRRSVPQLDSDNTGTIGFDDFRLGFGGHIDPSAASVCPLLRARARARACVPKWAQRVPPRASRIALSQPSACVAAAPLTRPHPLAAPLTRPHPPRPVCGSAAPGRTGIKPAAAEGPGWRRR